MVNFILYFQKTLLLEENICRTYNKTKRVKERQYKKQLLEKIENLHTENSKEYWNLIDKLTDDNSCNPC